MKQIIEKFKLKMLNYQQLVFKSKTQHEAEQHRKNALAFVMKWIKENLESFEIKCTWKFSEETEEYPTIVCYYGISEYNKGETEICQHCEFAR